MGDGKPIVFNAEMVRAILDERKTQTRRLVKSYYNVDLKRVLDPSKDGTFDFVFNNKEESSHLVKCPFGQPGDFLWVKETFARYPQFTYKADRYEFKDSNGKVWIPKWTPSIHMPRHLSRILLQVINIRVERVQDISEEDVKAEGVKPTINSSRCLDKYKSSFESLWDSINKEGSKWDDNPWVWVIEFNQYKVD